jgi:hypothetical protein
VLGVTVNCSVDPWLAACGVPGEIVPFAPALGVTVYVLRAKLAATVQLWVMGPVVYVVPFNVPAAQVPPIVGVKPAAGVTVNWSVEPWFAGWPPVGEIVPFAPALEVTV